MPNFFAQRRNLRQNLAVIDFETEILTVSFLLHMEKKQCFDKKNDGLKCALSLPFFFFYVRFFFLKGNLFPLPFGCPFFFELPLFFPKGKLSYPLFFALIFLPFFRYSLKFAFIEFFLNMNVRCRECETKSGCR